METEYRFGTDYNEGMRLRFVMLVSVLLFGLIAVSVRASEPLVTIDVVDGDVTDVYHSIAEQAGFNIVVHPTAAGTITVKLVDVPWRKALEVLLETVRHEARIDVNTIFVAPMGKLR